MKTRFKTYMIKDREECKKEYLDVKDQVTSGHVSLNWNETEIELEVYEGSMSSEDLNTILSIFEKYSGLDFSHRKK